MIYNFFKKTDSNKIKYTNIKRKIKVNLFNFNNIKYILIIINMLKKILKLI